MSKTVAQLFKSDFLSSPDEFLSLRIDNLAEKMDLEKRGRENGQADQPEQDHTALDSVEGEIVTRMRDEAARAHSRTIDQLAVFEERLASVDPSGAAANMDSLGTQAEANFRARLVEWKGRLTDARRDLTDAETALVEFKEANELRRPPQPKKPKHWLLAGLAVMALVEVVPSAFMIAPGDEGGLLGGFASAVIFTLLSMTLGFLTGLLSLPYTGHRKAVLRVVGWTVSAALICLVLGINLSLAHFRAAVIAGATSIEAAAQTLPSLISDPFNLGDINSVLMAGLGMLFAFGALLEGRAWRDPYPGYETAAEARRRAAKNFHRMIEDSLADLKDLEEEFIEKVGNERSSLRDRRQQVPRILEGRKRLVQRYASFRAHVQETGRALLAVYREANRKARKAPPPAHFSDSWVLDGFEVPALDDSSYSFPDEDFRAADEALRAATQKLQDAYSEGVAWIEKRAVEAGSAE